MAAPILPPTSRGIIREKETVPNQATHTNDETKNQLDPIHFYLINDENNKI